MISSMTAFARTQRQGEWGTLTCEMRSINHRFLEMSLHVPDILRVLEMPIRELIRQHIKRGKIECTIRFQQNQAKPNTSLSINTALAKELCQAGEKIAAFIHEPQKINPIEIMRFPGVMETAEANLEALEKEVLLLVEKTTEELLAARKREGEELKRLFFQRLDAMREELSKVRSRYPQVVTDQRERLTKRFQEAKVELDPNRLEQEMLIFAQRLDVSEEMERFETHIQEVRRMLDQGGLIGRRFDFLLQELNREANTLGSKSVDSVVTHAAVEMKVLIEQVREQVQNIE